MVWRSDAFSIFYGILHMSLLMLSRRNQANVWTVACIVYSLVIVAQVVAAIGLPLCFQHIFPEYLFIFHIFEKLKFTKPAHYSYLLSDSIAFFLMCAQRKNFKVEGKYYGKVGNVHLGGNNDPCNFKGIELDIDLNGTNDFMSNQKTSLDQLKYMLLPNLFWLCMFCLYMSASCELSIITLPLYIACFYWLWFGPKRMIQCNQHLRRLWSYMIYYVHLVIILYLIREVFHENSSFATNYFKQILLKFKGKGCAFIQIFNLVASMKDIDMSKFAKEDCFITIKPHNNHLMWIVIAFIFMLMQKRLYVSYYFQHIIVELYIQGQLSHRGNELINQNLLRQIKRRQDKDTGLMAKIRTNIQLIRKKQLKYNEDKVISDDHYRIIRSGDHYMFDDNANNDTFVMPKFQYEDFNLNALQILNMYLQHGAIKTLAAIERDKKITQHSSFVRKFAYKWLNLTSFKRKNEKAPLKTHIAVYYGIYLNTFDKIMFKINTWLIDYRRISSSLSMYKMKQKMLLSHKEMSLSEAERIIKIRKIVISNAEKSFWDIFGLSKYNRFISCMKAINDFIVSLSDVLCFSIMILNPLMNASVLSIPFPLSVFLWALLCVPRPKTNYWLTMMIYVEIVIIIKYFCSTDIILAYFETTVKGPLHITRIFGVDMKYSYNMIDTALLFLLFVHCSILKSKGIWKYTENKTPAILDTENEIRTIVDTQKQIYGVVETNNSLWFRFVSTPIDRIYKFLTISRYNIVTDVYARMFLCDVFGFVIVLVGYKNFAPLGESKMENVSYIIYDNVVPPAFVLMLLVLFFCILIDRMLFLRRKVFGKFLLQIILVLLVHVWMFVVLPVVTQRPFSDNSTVQLWYFVKCIYFGLSAHQIRCRYPARILGNFLTSKYNYTNLFLFKMFQLSPFLLEIRYLMDWMWTNTCLGIYSWMQMEDIYNQAFITACFLAAEDRYVTPRATKRSLILKYSIGGFILSFLFLIIWFPLLFFSLKSKVSIAHAPEGCTLSVQFARYEPIYEMSVQQHQLNKLPEKNWESFTNIYTDDVMISDYLSEYSSDDIYTLKIAGEASSLWKISPPNIISMINDLQNDKIIFPINIVIEINSVQTNQLEYMHILETDEASMEIRQKLVQVLQRKNQTGSTNVNSVIIPHILYRFLRVSNKRIDNLRYLNDDTVNLTLQLHTSTSNEMWWSLKELRSPNDFDSSSNKKSDVVKLYNYIQLVTFNQRQPHQYLKSLVNIGVLGMYMALVLVISKLVRVVIDNVSYYIIYSEIPDVQPIIQLCQDIYMVRENEEYDLEEELFARLIFLYRSPETLFRVTRRKNNDLISELVKKNQTKPGPDSLFKKIM